MKEISQNGSDRGAEASASSSHDEFVELCALSTTDTLTPDEWVQLHAHLKNCASCRELKQQYDNLAFGKMPALAQNLMEQSEKRRQPVSWSREQAEERLMQRLDVEPVPWNNKSVDSPRYSWPNHLRRYAIAALILLVGGACVYRLVVHLTRKPKSVTSPVAVVSPVTVPAIRQANVAQEASEQRNREFVLLRVELQHRLAELEQLKTKNSQLENDLKQRTSDLDQSSHDRALLDQKAATAEAELGELRAKLDTIASRESQETVQLASLQSEVNGAREALQQKDHEVAQDEDLLTHDRDIRDLIAARNLYIVDVYDMKKSGVMQKPVGRVFYTKDKSLIFYGYDLDQQPGLKNASAFQAWGATATNANSVSLGLFYRDDTNKDRWMLRYNDAKTIARLDRIFVTVEPEGGSKKPTGKPLLITSLRIEPNHP